MVTTLGIPYNLNEINKELYNKFLRENEDKGKDFKECGSFQLTEGSTYTCSVAYTNEVQDTISISNSRGTSYHKSYGKVYSKGDTSTDEINKSIELAHALSGSKSFSKSLSEGGSSSIKKVYTVINSNSKALSDTRESSHAETNERSISHIESEEQSRATTNSKEHSEETNWSTTHETSHNDEYTYMNPEEYKAVANVKNEYRNVDKGLSNFEKGVGKVDSFVGKAGEIIGKGYDYIKNKISKNKRENKFEILESEYEIKNKYNYKRNNILESNQKTTLSKRWVQLLTEILGLAMAAKQSSEGKLKSFVDSTMNVVGTYGNIMVGYDANRIQRAALDEQYNIALDQENAQYKLAVASTHSSSDTTSDSTTHGVL